MFRAQLPAALDFLAQKKRIEYLDLLKVHQILFEGLYPWDGKDRAEILPNSAIRKKGLYFSHPSECRLAVSEGLSFANDKKQMSNRPGFIMGMFAYGHPFLDGNGRTMLLIHHLATLIQILKKNIWRLNAGECIGLEQISR